MAKKIMTKEPRIIEFPKMGSPKLGYISIAEIEELIPFEIKRVYWTYYTPNDVQRGFHAHKKLHQVIIAVSGIIKFSLKDQEKKETQIVLDNPSKGIYIPEMYWREISFSHNAVLLCIASEIFDENDYIRDFKQFTSHVNEK